MRMKMKMLTFICLVARVTSSFRDDTVVHSKDHCWSSAKNNTIADSFGALVSFSPTVFEAVDACSVHISNPWSSEIKDGFGVFLPHGMDCGSTIIAECLPGSTLLRQTAPSSVEYTCHTNTSDTVMPCNSISLTYKRNMSHQGTRRTADVQVLALVKEPCADKHIFYRCPKDYSHSCVDRKLQCNGRTECPNGGDEFDCEPSYIGGYIPLGLIILLILGFLVVTCVISAIVVCCCCRAACHAIIRRFHPSKKQKTLERGDMSMVSGEDAGLMKSLAAPSVIDALPQRHAEPEPLLIDSTKPVYPRLP